jgi:CBS domain-containing protein
MRTPTVTDVMTTRVTAVRLDATFKEMSARLRERRISAFPVISGSGKVLGIVSAADLMTREALDGRHAGLLHRKDDVKAAALTAGGLMTSPAVTITADASVTEAARVMRARKVKRLPVVDSDGTLIGIVSRTDLLAVYDRPPGQIRDDILNGVIRDELLADPSAFMITVNDGVVTIEGTPETVSVGHDIIDEARHVPGVVAVRDRLRYPATAYSYLPSGPIIG